MEILNRKARFNYFIIEEIECGIELFGSEVKSIRNGNCNIKDSYGVIRNNEVYLINMFIKNYKEASIFNKEETRKRRLLLHKKEIIKLDNGYYLETIIEETSMARAANQKTARKTANYKNAQGAIMFSVTVTGTFTYTGSSSTCTKSVAEASSKNTNWKISSKSASKSGNKATAKAIAKRYVDGVAVETQNCTVTLICSSNGSLK